MIFLKKIMWRFIEATVGILLTRRDRELLKRLRLVISRFMEKFQNRFLVGIPTKIEQFQLKKSQHIFMMSH